MEEEQKEDLLGATYYTWRKRGKKDVHAVVGKGTLCTVSGMGERMDGAAVTCAMCLLHIEANQMTMETTP
jgi:hypothetical protein